MTEIQQIKFLLERELVLLQEMLLARQRGIKYLTTYNSQVISKGKLRCFWRDIKAQQKEVQRLTEQHGKEKTGR